MKEEEERKAVTLKRGIESKYSIYIQYIHSGYRAM